MRRSKRRYRRHWQNIVQNARCHLEDVQNVKTPVDADDMQIAKEYLKSQARDAREALHSLCFKRVPLVASACMLFTLAFGLLMLIPLLVYDIALALIWPLLLFLGLFRAYKAERYYEQWFPNDEFAGFE